MSIPSSDLDAIGQVNPAGEAMAHELQAIHRLIRANLASIRKLMDEIVAGAEVSDIRQEIDELRSSGIVWTLRLGCLRYCRFVHGHHGLEDAALFPGIRRVNPALSPVIDKLIADHRVVASLLDQIERAATALEIVPEARGDLAAGLSSLSDHLLAHLDYEEENLVPTLSRLSEWPL